MQEIRSINRRHAGPYNIEAEQQVLGAILSDNARLDLVSDILRPEHFSDGMHAEIYRASVDLINAGRIASPITLKALVESHPSSHETGGAKYLVRLVGFAMATFAARDYAQQIVDAYTNREIVALAQDAEARAMAGVEVPAKIVESVEVRASEIASKGTYKPLIRSHMGGIRDALAKANSAYLGEGTPSISTGITQLDAILGGLVPGRMVVLAGRTSMGKTTIAQNIAYHVARHQGRGVLFWTREMTAGELGNRFLSKGLAERGIEVSYSDLQMGNVSEDRMRAAVEEGQRQAEIPLSFVEGDIRTIDGIKAAAKRAHRAMKDGAGLGLIVLDYVQRIYVPNARSGHEKVSAASEMAKDLAIDLDVPVLCLAQLNRGVEGRDNKVPMLSDLKESGSLEEDADQVVFAYRDEYYLQRHLEALRNQKGKDTEVLELQAALADVRDKLDLIVPKNRHGRTGTATAYMRPALCHVTNDRHAKEGELL